MNKSELIEYIVEHNNITKSEADNIINIFTESVINILGEGNEISLVGFGNFKVSTISAREGRNPRTNEPLSIPAHNRPRFSAGKKLKNACNKDNKSNNKADSKKTNKKQDAQPIKKEKVNTSASKEKAGTPSKSATKKKK